MEKTLFTVNIEKPMEWFEKWKKDNPDKKVIHYHMQMHAVEIVYEMKDTKKSN